ncbi:hypothetical protein SS50377_21132 [Spironucleus salmonicida]|uniref:Uncharacterized protein n=1 Tax=Spironucleus salmonicida TaxID=348837 RepID=V6LSZ2_9EUKA|nr:hypothetical protein SS50377_21132 [Spironucleus salmonicida]|eukprot:EST43914.1 Hypothetical protein SS50377_16215 [Spironucleus salmonicida]
MYQTSKWICSDVLNIQILTILKQIQVLDASIVDDVSMLVPEKQRATHVYLLNRVRVETYVESNQLHDLHLKFIQLIVKSPYINLVFYPVLDITQNWTSFLGLSYDGITLIDQELGNAYLFFPFEYFTANYFGDNEINIIIKKQLRSVIQQLKPLIVNDTTTQFIQEQPLSAKIRDFVVNTTKKIDLPIVSKLLEEGKSNKSFEKIVQFKIDQSHKYIDDPVLVQPDTESEILATNDILNVRETLQIRFKNVNIASAIFQYINYCQQSALLNTAFQPVRNYRIMSSSTLELFKQIYFNNCIKCCVSPSISLIKKIDDILDSNNGQTFHDFEFIKEKLTNLSLRALILSLIHTFEFDPESGIFCINTVQTNNQIRIKTWKYSQNCNQEHGVLRYFRGGQGTPYDPFVPMITTIKKNLMVSRFSLVQNEFSSLQWIGEISKLFAIQVIQQQLLVVEISDNLTLNKGVIVLADQLHKIKNLKALHINQLQIKQTGVLCLLYLLDSTNIYLQQLSLQDAQISSRSAWLQLGIYIGRCIKKFEKFEKLDLSGCKITQQHIQSFIQGLQQGRGNKETIIQELVARKCIVQQDMLVHEMLINISSKLII